MRMISGIFFDLYNGGIAKRSNAADCKSALSEFDGSNPSPTTTLTGTLRAGFFVGAKATRIPRPSIHACAS